MRELVEFIAVRDDSASFELFGPGFSCAWFAASGFVGHNIDNS